MKTTEAATLLTLVAAYDPRREVDESVARVWADALDGIDVRDAVQAVKAHYLDSAHPVMIADVRRRVTAVRSARHDALDVSGVIPPSDLSVREEIEWRRALDKAVGDGDVTAANLDEWLGRVAREALETARPMPDLGGVLRSAPSA